jgi:hypothetical protein
MLHVGLDLSRKRLDVCLLSDRGSWSKSSPPSLTTTVGTAPDGTGYSRAAEERDVGVALTSHRVALPRAG